MVFLEVAWHSYRLHCNPRGGLGLLPEGCLLGPVPAEVRVCWFWSASAAFPDSGLLLPLSLTRACSGEGCWLGPALAEVLITAHLKKEILLLYHGMETQRRIVAVNGTNGRVKLDESRGDGELVCGRKGPVNMEEQS